jgi:hypothetical protein
MKTIYLHQQATLNTGVIGVLRIRDKEFQTLETSKCLPAGKHKISLIDGRYFVGKDYPICMDSNGQYRNKGLVIGKEWDFRRFDLLRKGDALQEVLREVCPEEGLILEVTKTSESQKETITRLQKENEQLELCAKEAVENITLENGKVLELLEDELAALQEEFNALTIRYAKVVEPGDSKADGKKG